MRPLAALIYLLSIFFVASSCLFMAAKQFSTVILHQEGQASLKFPSNLDDLKDIAELIKFHKEANFVYVVLLFCAAYLYKQTFAIPGSVFMNVLSGALFGIWYGFPFICLLTAMGATFCYLLSKNFGKSILLHFFSEKLTSLQKKVDQNDEGLLFFLLCLRLFPMSPNWFLNMSSPILNIPISYFFVSVFIGLMPYNFICCQAGCILSELTSLDQILTLSVFLKMALAALVVASPGLIMRVLKKERQKQC